VTTLASWNSLKLPIRDCIRWLIPRTARQRNSQDEDGGDERKIRQDRDMHEEEGGDRSGGRVPPRRSRWGRPPLWLAAGGPDGRGWLEGGKESFLLLYCIWLAALGAFLGSSSCMSTRS
jgi:hypothetical protein